jgi:tRNA pseudouridine38-40 synthase
LKRIVFGLQYDGAPWLGYQTQPHRQTVQDQLEAALNRFACQPLHTTCAGRTDAGVHALEQVIHFDTDLVREPFSWVRGTNAYLPPSIAVRWAREVPHHGLIDNQQFHARFSARVRCYHYVLYNHPIHSPILRGKAGWVFRPLDVERMQQGANYLLGNHDFSAFRAAQCQAKTPVKDMHQIEIERKGDMIVFTLRASAFLHHMVRNIVGSLIVVGTGNQRPEWMAELLAGRDRSKAAPTFMPDGLYLAHIAYEPQWDLPQQAGLLPWL